MKSLVLNVADACWYGKHPTYSPWRARIGYVWLKFKKYELGIRNRKNEINFNKL